MHLFASSGHNDENDVSNDIDVVEDEGNDGEGDNVVDGDVDDNGDGDNNGDGKNHDDDEVPFCERPQWHLFRWSLSPVWQAKRHLNRKQKIIPESSYKPFILLILYSLKLI